MLMNTQLSFLAMLASQASDSCLVAELRHFFTIFVKDHLSAQGCTPPLCVYLIGETEVQDG